MFKESERGEESDKGSGDNFMNCATSVQKRQKRRHYQVGDKWLNEVEV